MESIGTYGVETWTLNKQESKILLVVEMDFWVEILRLDHVSSENISEIVEADETIDP